MKCINFLKLQGEKIPKKPTFLWAILLIGGVLALNSVNCIYFKVYTLSMPSGYRIVLFSITNCKIVHLKRARMVVLLVLHLNNMSASIQTPLYTKLAF